MDEIVKSITYLKLQYNTKVNYIREFSREYFNGLVFT